MTNKGISAIAEWLQVMWGGKPSEAGFLALIGTKNTHTRFRSMGIWDANDVLKIRTVEELAARLHVPALALFAVLYPPDSDYDLPYLFSALRAAGFDDADFAAASATSPLLPALKRVEVPDIGDGELAPGVRQEIVSRLTNPHLGISMRQIARDLGVSHETVRLIKNKLKGKNDE